MSCSEYLYKGESLQYKWDYEQFCNENVATRKVIFEKWPEKCKIIITSTPIEVGVRRLKTMWTTQMTKDVAAYNSINAEEELTAFLNTNVENVQTRKVLIEKIDVDLHYFQKNYSLL